MFRLGKRALQDSPGLLEKLRAKGVGTGAATFRLGSRIRNAHKSQKPWKSPDAHEVPAKPKPGAAKTTTKPKAVSRKTTQPAAAAE